MEPTCISLLQKKILNGLYVQEWLATGFLLAAWAINKIPSILNVTLWKLREITLLTLPQGMLPLEKSKAVKPQSKSSRTFSQMIISKKLARVAQKLASKKVKQFWKSNSYLYNKSLNDPYNKWPDNWSLWCLLTTREQLGSWLASAASPASAAGGW